ncbi:hypothetical protein HMPREF1317_1076 [Schaalia georgiae F0490]|uniref:Uncharacterized protein n=1 Tax=Schaalia georgiae F0490 TaxID=1125717 RepID=J0NIE3_9ACTO|nr:hypothetical protein HMPREF1317_1076 [Schaalia georgiae F0490]
MRMERFLIPTIVRGRPCAVAPAPRSRTMSQSNGGTGA